MSDNGKGDSPRPLSVDPDTFANNWDRTFSDFSPEVLSTEPPTLDEIKDDLDKLEQKIKEQLHEES